MSIAPNYQNTIGVLFGGRSCEHEISLRSAVYILKNIPEKYFILPIGISRKGEFYSLTGEFTKHHFNQITTDCLAQIIAGKVPAGFESSSNLLSVFLPLRQELITEELQEKSPLRILNNEAFCFFPVLHGTNGEDGRLQGMFECAEMAYVGCDIRASVIGIDKDIQKRLAKSANIPIARYEVVDLEELEVNQQAVLKRVEESLGYPCFVKPNSMGSAVGASKITNQLELKLALKEATAFDQKALVEELLEGTEVETAFLGTPLFPQVTCAGELVSKGFYSYEEKYGPQSQTIQYIPARLSQERAEELKRLSVQIVKIMGINGFARIDFWNIPKTNTFVFNEFNTIPGLTSISMFPKLWEHEKLFGPDWIELLVQNALARMNMIKRAQFGIRADIHQNI
jgi:D-alanine-D-alanine ligase